MKAYFYSNFFPFSKMKRKIIIDNDFPPPQPTAGQKGMALDRVFQVLWKSKISHCSDSTGLEGCPSHPSWPKGSQLDEET